MLEFQCCLCKKSIGPGEEGPRGFDPCALIIVASWAKAQEEQREQQFYCHFECFRQTLNDDGNLYIMDPDFSPNVGLGDDDENPTSN